MQRAATMIASAVAIIATEPRNLILRFSNAASTR